MKALGLTLDVQKDCFKIDSPEPFDEHTMTKRGVLSYISKFYDPMGFASPIVIKAKSIMQKIWSYNIGWDEHIPNELVDEWLQFARSLAAMHPIHLDRHIPTINAAAVQLIGFADASSTTGYGCCIYLRVVDKTGKAELSLLCSKSRVNPRANALTIPRLELNAALLLSILIERVYDTLHKNIQIDDVYLFTDSKITLAWIQTELTRLQAYVANRVAVIQQKTDRWRWLYVASAENPADLISRGISPQELPTCALWWKGPKFLQSRLKAGAAKQLMGSLPQHRVTSCRPFQKVGMDFAGPIQVKNSRVRKAIVSKGYVCIYVCFVTKAIHLELTSDLSTDAFLASFKRFISRRGLPSDVFCDNGGCFRGARNQLAELYKLNSSAAHQTLVQAYAAKEGIQFHFTPSYAPVFAGLAEAAVKSMKYHLKRIVLDAALTYEQLHTVLCQIEAVLNSRPILPLSEDVNDYCYLTPGHFLIGTALTMYPEVDISETKVNRLGFWQQCIQLQQRFWKAWYKYYLNTLQNRNKWCKSMPNVTVGALVLMREANVPPLAWPMARVVDVFPGNDGKVRALQLKTANGQLYTRSLQSISVLPIEK
ncbi:uncharacterized protein LOC124530918 [Vanessa cardui]|uniref:uncharacterized protein LOC124530918 n=1 Tax=Vanessa cardui TaxID=171605 RepID=UPI001F12A536|nr:uncharacterized protein LOC124530918 [Vanessa cardui]